jgi:hypothetical protein
MSGSLVKIDEEIVTSAVNSVTLTGIDSTYDVYMLVTVGLKSTITEALSMRFAESGTLNATANYDWAYKELNAGGAFSNPSNPNFNEIRFGATSSGNNWDNTIHYIYNAYNSSEYTFVTSENVRYGAITMQGRQGGGVFTVASQVNGVGIGIFTNPTNNLTAGTITLYGLKK